jgi:signal transduction histidine kinase
MVGGLRIRLLLMTLAPLVPVLVVAFVNAQHTREDSLGQVRGEMRSFARLAGSWVQQRVDLTEERLRTLDASPTVQGGGRGCGRALRDELRRTPADENLLVTDAGGRVVCAARAAAAVGAADWFGDLRQGAASAVGTNMAGQRRPALVVAVRRGGAGGGFTGAVAAVVDLRLFNRLAASIQLPRDASMLILERGGTVLARHPELPSALGRSVTRTALGRAARAGVADAEVNGLDGVRRIYGFDRVAAGALVVAAGLSRDAVGAEADRTLRRTLLVLGLVALLVVPLVLLVANLLIARPVRGAAAAHQGERERSVRERRRLLADLVAAEDDVRKRVAEDIHDDSIQALAALLLRLEMLESRLEDDDLRGRAAEAREAARGAVERLRHLMFQLNPPALETAGLAAALTDYVTEIGRVWERDTAVDDELQAEPDPESRVLLYRIAVEAVNNAARHAGGARIEVSLASVDGGVRVCVHDDGPGFDVEAAAVPRPGHLGLKGMRERAETAGGWWRVDSSPGEGTTVEFFVPG